MLCNILQLDQTASSRQPLTARTLCAQDESEGLLGCLRCSCMSLRAKKLAVLLPFAAVASVSAAVTGTHWTLRCAQPLHAFLIGR